MLFRKKIRKILQAWGLQLYLKKIPVPVLSCEV